MESYQGGVLGPVPPHGRYLTFRLTAPAQANRALKILAGIANGENCVVGLGQSLLGAIGRELPDLKPFPASSSEKATVPSTPSDLWCWLRGTSRGDLFELSRAFVDKLGCAFTLDNAVDAFKHGSGRDLTGYEDGTENPKDQAAVDAAIVSGRGPGFDGSSFVAVQQWVHDFHAFEAMTGKAQDDSIGRRKSDNVELEDAPESSHVKRTAQESFTPEAFMMRRSMPWNDATRGGLMFVAFGRSFDAFEAQLKRMTGGEDGVIDALFKFTQPVTGAYFWCPPLSGGRLDLRAVGL
jgi:putative iron-dependent peroxidase